MRPGIPEQDSRFPRILKESVQSLPVLAPPTCLVHQPLRHGPRPDGAAQANNDNALPPYLTPTLPFPTGAHNVHRHVMECLPFAVHGCEPLVQCARGLQSVLSAACCEEVRGHASVSSMLAWRGVPCASNSKNCIQLMVCKQFTIEIMFDAVKASGCGEEAK